MKTIKSLVTLLTLSMIFSCSDKDPSDIQTPDAKPEPTAMGYPNGTPNIMSIGPAGGSIASIDGQMVLDIPAGALSSDTPIIIQPVTNNAPNGNGNAYLLAPEGITFAKPVKITFKSDHEVSDAVPALTGIAFHDKDGLWYTAGKLTWDNSTKTISVETTHFSEWVTFDLMQLACSEQKLEPGQSAECIILAVDNDLSADDVLPLIKSNGKNDFSFILKEWRLNGALAAQMGKYGQITPIKRDVEAVCTYMAPAKVPQSGNPVNISAILQNLAYKDPRSKKLFNDLQLVTKMEIIGERKYDLRIYYDARNTLSDVLIDSVAINVLIKNGDVTFSKFYNYPGYVIPSSKTFPNGCTTTWVVDGYKGPMDFSDASAIIDVNKKMIVTLSGSTFTPAFSTLCPGNPVSNTPAIGSALTWPTPLEFNLNDTVPKFKDKSGVVTATLFPVE